MNPWPAMAWWHLSRDEAQLSRMGASTTHECDPKTEMSDFLKCISRLGRISRCRTPFSFSFQIASLRSFKAFIIIFFSVLYQQFLDLESFQMVVELLVSLNHGQCLKYPVIIKLLIFECSPLQKWVCQN